MKIVGSVAVNRYTGTGRNKKHGFFKPCSVILLLPQGNGALFFLKRIAGKTKST